MPAGRRGRAAGGPAFFLAGDLFAGPGHGWRGCAGAAEAAVGATPSAGGWPCGREKMCARTCHRPPWNRMCGATASRSRGETRQSRAATSLSKCQRVSTTRKPSARYVRCARSAYPFDVSVKSGPGYSSSSQPITAASMRLATPLPWCSGGTCTPHRYSPVASRRFTATRPTATPSSHATRYRCRPSSRVFASMAAACGGSERCERSNAW